jgi:hypothetical protein
MQIYYCDACGLRVNNSELVPTGEKVYCNACAQKLPTQELPIPRATPSSGVQTPQRTQSGGQKLPTPQRGTGSFSRNPFGSGEGLAARQTGGHEAKPRSGHTGAVPRPASASARTAGGAKPKDNSTLIYAGAGAGAMLLVVVLVLATRGDAEPEKAPAESKPTPPPTTTVAKKEPEPPVAPPAPVEVKQPPVDPGIDDIRENMARREFANAQQQARSAGNNIVAARRVLVDFVRRYRTTKAGQEALAQLESMSKVNARAADNPGSTVAGLKCEVYERGNEHDRIRGINYGALKKSGEKTIDRIDWGDKGKVGAALGREEFLIAVFTGYVEVPADGDYSFFVASDDASLLYIGDWLVVDNDDHHAVREIGETVPLKKGKHRIRLEYSQGSGLAECHFSIAGPNLPKTIVPPNMLSRNP